MTEPARESEFYAAPSPTSDLARHAAALGEWGSTPEDAGRIACNAILHIGGAHRYRSKLSAERFEGLDVRSAARIVDHVLDLRADPLTVERRPLERMVGNCYHFALLTCALLRSAGIAARTRVGFASYLERGMWTDHWICEVHEDDRWRRFDPDGAIWFDRGTPKRFLSAGEAWSTCRSGQADPGVFGIDDARGWWFIRNNVVRDFASLCKVELLPWDFWGLMVGQDADRPDELLDELSATCADDATWAERYRRFADDSLINPGGRVFVFRGGTREHDLPDEW